MVRKMSKSLRRVIIIIFAVHLLEVRCTSVLILRPQSRAVDVTLSRIFSRRGGMEKYSAAGSSLRLPWVFPRHPSIHSRVLHAARCTLLHAARPARCTFCTLLHAARPARCTLHGLHAARSPHRHRGFRSPSVHRRSSQQRWLAK